MKYLLDTNICIFAIKENPKILEALSLKKSEGLAISAITLAELQYGVYNSAAIEKNMAKLLAFLPIVKVLDFDDIAAVEYGKICTALRKRGTPIGSMDTLIAAHAKSAGLVCVTNNVREFERVSGLVIEDWKNNGVGLRA
ncbi:MAG: type II toxin-antitoxin system VapC family toxin [Oscillospiraceae bacterium]|nr:type II toxin-antitoxin system VapC family toxin [Oscillospiraceae bacterium]